MARALELARRGQWTTWPNPMVGCVVVMNGRIVAQGWHRRWGGAHAEVDALSQIPEHVDLVQATVFVTLEPCSHHGKTPPCADLLIRRRVGRVVVALHDPNPLVAGQGIARLRASGIAVDVGVLAEEARALNRRFCQAIRAPRPWVTLKWAQSFDGFMDPDPHAAIGRGSVPVSGQGTQRHTHGLRATHDGILVGMRTLLVDEPRLDTRRVPGMNPQRLVWTRGHTPPPQGWRPKRQIAADLQPVALLHPPTADASVLDAWRGLGAQTHELHGALGTEEWWESLRERTGLHAVLVEGGATLHGLVLARDGWDEIHRYTATQTLGSGLPAPALPDHAERVSACGLLDGERLEVWQHPRHLGTRGECEAPVHET